MAHGVHYLGGKERERERTETAKGRFPCDTVDRFSPLGCPVSAQHAQLDRSCVSQSYEKCFS